MSIAQQISSIKFTNSANEQRIFFESPAGSVGMIDLNHGPQVEGVPDGYIDAMLTIMLKLTGKKRIKTELTTDDTYNICLSVADANTIVRSINAYLKSKRNF